MMLTVNKKKLCNNELVHAGFRLCEEINRYGYEAYLVGGCVRDILMDYDSPWAGEDNWDKSWVIPLEFEMEDGRIVKSALKYFSEYDCFDYDEENYDFCAYFDVYGIVKWRYASETSIVNT